MLVYFLKSSACLAIFMLFYVMFLEKESMNKFKRFYLMATLLLAFVIPLVTFTEYVEVPPSAEKVGIVLQSHTSEVLMAQDPHTDYLPIILWSIYILGVLLFGTIFLKNLYQIIQRIRKNPKYRSNHIIQVLLNDHIVPHTFFQYIFLNKNKFEAKEIPEAVLLHEEIHANQKHSLDVLCVELLQVLFWFNPLFYIIKKAIKLNHEFLADQAVVKTGIPTNTYQSLLLAFSSNAPVPQLANSINYSSTHLTLFGKTFTLGPSAVGQVKKRMSVMKKSTSKQSIALRSVVLLPLLAALLFGFGNKELVEVIKEPYYDSELEIGEIMEVHVNDENQGATPKELEQFNFLAKKYNAQPQKTRKIPVNDLKTLEDIYRVMTPTQKENAQPFPECPPLQDGATASQIKEYNSLAKKYNAMSKNNFRVVGKEVERLQSIYEIMTDKQKEKAEPFPNFPPPPPAPDTPEMVNNSDLPPPPPIPADAPKAERKAYEKTIKNYEKGNPGIKKSKKTKDGQVIEIIEISEGDELSPLPPPAPYIKNGGQPSVPSATNTKNQIKIKKIIKLSDIHEAPEAFEIDEIEKIEEIEEREMIDELQEGQERIEIENDMTEMESPDPPEPPMSPIDHIVQMAKENATFYFEGKKINSDKAIDILKKNNQINIDINAKDGKPPVVKLSKEPIEHEN